MVLDAGHRMVKVLQQFVDAPGILTNPVLGPLAFSIFLPGSEQWAVPRASGWCTDDDSGPHPFLHLPAHFSCQLMRYWILSLVHGGCITSI